LSHCPAAVKGGSRGSAIRLPLPVDFGLEITYMERLDMIFFRGVETTMMQTPEIRPGDMSDFHGTNLLFGKKQCTIPSCINGDRTRGATRLRKG
jgi:hypothetical protein